ncbi:MAG: hypothetical protein OZ917_01560 [Candidatus Brocadiaceae bacterium]|nr:hypothetical protein [Candidatus Brocadiaceae bacterium]
MAIWKRKWKKKGSEESLQKEVVPEEIRLGIPPESSGEEPLTKEQPKNKEPDPEQPPEGKDRESGVEFERYMHGGVIVGDRKISGFFVKGFWGVLSIFVLPPVLIFPLSILVIVCMLVFPLMAIALIALIPAVFVTLFILIIALPVFFPLLILFLLITGKGRLLIGSEGKWFSIEMFGKRYTLE